MLMSKRLPRGRARALIAVSSLCQDSAAFLLGALLFAGGALLFTGCHRETAGPARSPSRASGGVSQELAAQVTQIEAREEHFNETTWVKEMLAEDCGRVIESFWDSVNASSNKLDLAAAFPLGRITLGKWDEAKRLPHGISLWSSKGRARTLSPDQWRQFVQDSARAGWRLVQTEFRHNQFDTDAQGQPRQSQFYFSAHLTNSAICERAILEGDLTIDWAAGPREQPPVVAGIDASKLTIKSRRGEPPFELIACERIPSRMSGAWIGPLNLYDLDGDGLSEIILPLNNEVYRRRAGGEYAPETLCREPARGVFTAVVADFDGDGAADLLCATPDGLVLFSGSKDGKFDAPGRLAWKASPLLVNPMALTCGDVDGDGDLDVFLAQYKLPYADGQMPTPYYDANDGYPAYLLLNDGHGNLTDATVAAGLESKRRRRTFSASLADLDNDGRLDLVVVSDFAGLDLYRNDGHGHFTDVTRAWVPESHAFGMAQTMADFNSDGRLDLLVIGMPSPAVDRLEHLDLWRPGDTEDHRLRREMAFGNRLFLAKASGGFEKALANGSIARSGWSWGCTAFDFDNDGFPDVYITNGMESRNSVHDYDPEFWLHDQFVANSSPNLAVYDYIRGKVTRLRGRGGSYGGYDKNRLFLNQGGASFVEAAHLFGVALELDSRNVVSDDLDGDGRVDLLVTSFEPWPHPSQTLRIYRNKLEDGGNWIGFRFREEGRGRSPVGVRVTIRYGGRTAVRQIVTGDSHRAQHASTVHFGLGKAERVDTAEIRYPGGEVLTLRQPAINRYHLVRPPARTRAQP
jgi:FG-GAP-like repeat/ASPIC and UnbV